MKTYFHAVPQAMAISAALPDHGRCCCDLDKRPWHLRFWLVDDSTRGLF